MEDSDSSPLSAVFGHVGSKHPSSPIKSIPCLSGKAYLVDEQRNLIFTRTMKSIISVLGEYE